MKCYVKYIKLFILIVLSSVVAIALTCNMSIDNYYTHDKALMEYGRWTRFLTYCNRSFSGERFLMTVIAVLAGLLLLYLPKLRTNTKEKILAGVFSFLFSFMQLLGRSYSDNGSWEAVFGSHFIIFRSGIVLVGMMILVYSLVLYAFRIMDWLSDSETCQTGKFNRKYFLFSTLAIFVCWIPYFCFFFPGTGNADTSWQFMQFFHHPADWILNLTSVRGDDIYVTNHHPYFTTLVFGFFAKIGLWLGDISYGVALYNLIQMIVMAFTLSLVWFYLHWMGLSVRGTKIGIIFSALFPLFPLYAVCMIKDTMFSTVCLILTILLVEIVRSKGKALKHPWFCFLVLAASLLVALTKNQGVYILIIVAVLYLIVYRHYWLQIILSLFLPILFFQLVWMNILLPAWNVAPGGKQEAIGILFQMTARYVTEYPEEVTEEEADTIRKVIDYDNLSELYNPELADPVKYTFNQDVTDEELSDYYHVWAEMFFKHPEAYVQALIHNCYGSFYMSRNSSLTYYEFINRVEPDDNLYVDVPRAVSTQDRNKIIITFFQRIPFINLLFSVSSYIWMILFFFLDTIRKKKFAYILPMLIAIVSIGVLLVSPVNGSWRYVMPIFYMAPFLLGICVLDGKTEEEKI